MGMHVSRTSRGAVVRYVSRGSEKVRPQPNRPGKGRGGGKSAAGTGSSGGGTSGDFGADFE